MPSFFGASVLTLTVVQALLCGVAESAVTLAQTPARPPTFGTGVEIINLNLSVSDATIAAL